MSPSEVQAKLSAQTKSGMIPAFGRPWKFGEEQFRGRVGQNEFKVAPHIPANKRVLPTARGTLSEAAGGTRVHGEVGLEKGIVWYLRFAFLWALVVFGGALIGFGGFVLTEALMFMVPMALFMMVMMTLTLGSQVNRAEALSEELLGQLTTILGKAGAEPAAQAEAQRRPAPQKVAD